jgi:hypothetical protein
MSLTIKDILKVDLERKQITNEITKIHYQQCMRKIENAKENSKNSIAFQINRFLPCYPKYDQLIIAKKLAKHFTRKDFRCQVLSNDTLLLEWKVKPPSNEHLQFFRERIEECIQMQAKMQSKVQTEKRFICYTVPNVLVSYHYKYNTTEVIQTLQEHFIRAGFHVTSLDNNVIRISWEKDDLDALKQQKAELHATTTAKSKRLPTADELHRITRLNENRYLDFVNPKSVRITKPKEISKSNMETKYLNKLEDLKEGLRTIII